MSKTFHIFKWIPFAILTFVIVEEMHSSQSREIVINQISLFPQLTAHKIGVLPLEFIHQNLWIVLYFINLM
jgi:hypothetical protein